eukprot:gene495-3820_t
MARRWFHSTISGLEAQDLLLEHGHHGTYLVRPSQTNKTDYALSVLRKESVLHVKIQNSGDYYDLYGGEKFANLSELISYYTGEKNTLREKNGEEIELLQPLLCADPTADRLLDPSCFYGSSISRYKLLLISSPSSTPYLLYEFSHKFAATRWFHGSLSSREAENALLQRGQEGSFLVRSSTSQPGRYVLSVRRNLPDDYFPNNSKFSVKGEVTHIMIRAARGFYDLGGGQQFSTLQSLVEHYKMHPIIEANNRVVKLIQPFNATRLTLSAIDKRFKELSENTEVSDENAGFFEEFEQLQQMESQFIDKPRIEGSRPENKTKNRYKNILPYDETRVKLVDVEEEVGADYINANYINGEVKSAEKAYIASQGCMPATVPAFWQMIWENNVPIVLMLTKEVERGRHKCTAYWPKDGCKTEIFGKFTVILKDEQDYGIFVERSLEVQFGGQSRVVTQYHYINWPDHGVPDDDEILSLLLTVRQKKYELQHSSSDPVGPTVVHCSAGIGRTGTVIVIDIIMDRIEEEGTDIDIDIQKSIQNIRAQRSGMIQTAAQYRFVYKAIMDHISNFRSVSQGDDVTTVDRRHYEDIMLLSERETNVSLFHQYSFCFYYTSTHNDIGTQDIDLCMPILRG